MRMRQGFARAAGSGRLGVVPGAVGRKLVPLLKQIGDSVAPSGREHNWVTSMNLGNRSARFFCQREKSAPVLLPEQEHLRVAFAFPVKNVHITLTDLGRAGDNEAEVETLWEQHGTARSIWDSIYRVLGAPRRRILGNEPSEGGEAPRMRQLCPPPKTPRRVELHVTADDPRAQPGKVMQELDRGVDEVAQFEVRLVPDVGQPISMAPKGRQSEFHIPDRPFLESHAPAWLLAWKHCSWKQEVHSRRLLRGLFF